MSSGIKGRGKKFAIERIHAVWEVQLERKSSFRDLFRETSRVESSRPEILLELSRKIPADGRIFKRGQPEQRKTCAGFSRVERVAQNI